MFRNNIKITLIQIDNYRNWTTTLGCDRESTIQIFQAGIYSDIQRMFSQYGGIVFSTRYDNMLAVTNGISNTKQREIQLEFNSHNPTSVSLGIGCGETAYVAQKEASKNLLKLLNTNPTTMAFAAPSYGDTEEDLVQMAHFDVINSTGLITKRLSAYEAHILIQHIYNLLVTQLKKHGALVFFNGGDNFVAPSNGMIKEDYCKILDVVYRETGLMLRVGVGIDNTAKGALALANENLENMRTGKYDDPVYVKTGKQIPVNLIEFKK